MDDLHDVVQKACENLEKARASVIATTKLNVEQISLLQELRNSWIKTTRATKALSALLDKYALDECVLKKELTHQVSGVRESPELTRLSH